MALEFFFTPQQIIDEGRTTQEAIDVIKDWLPKTNLPKIQDELIVLFLLSCSNVIEATKNTIIAYYTCKINAPELYDDRDIAREELQRALSVVSFSSIPERTKDNYVVHFFKITDSSLSKFEIVPLMKMSYMLLDISQERHPPDGLIVVIDMKGFGLMHVTKLKLGAIKKYVQFLQEAFPIQMKAIHIINSVYFIDKVFNLFKMFMKSELIEMIKFHGSTDDMTKFFEEHVPIQCMPKDYGGKSSTMEELQVRCIKQFEEKKTFFEAEENMRKNNL